MPTLEETIDLFMQARRAARYSERTLADYGNTYKRFIRFLGCDPPIDSISVGCIRAFLASTTDVSAKTTLNYHIGLSSLWSWASDNGLVPANIVRQIQPPKPERREILPLSRSEFAAILAACQGRQGQRDRALLLLLLDTGMRASELCGLYMGDLSMPGCYCLVHGKGGRDRRLMFSQITAEAVQLTLQKRRFGPVFWSERGLALDRHTLRQALARIGERAGVARLHPHRLRHTFAIEFLRNGGNVYALQAALGHSTLDMCRRYLAISQADLESAMRAASPVTHWLE